MCTGWTGTVLSKTPTTIKRRYKYSAKNPKKPVAGTPVSCSTNYKSFNENNDVCRRKSQRELTYVNYLDESHPVFYSLFENIMNE